MYASSMEVRRQSLVTDLHFLNEISYAGWGVPDILEHLLCHDCIRALRGDLRDRYPLALPQPDGTAEGDAK